VTPAVRLILGLAVLVVAVALGGVMAATYPFLAALRVWP